MAILIVIVLVSTIGLILTAITALIYIRIASARDGAFFKIFSRRWDRTVRAQPCFDKLPRHFILLLLLHEDDRFFSHHGFNTPEILQSLKRSIWLRRLKGGSSITQQTAKRMILNHLPRLVRKVPESIATIILEMLYTKEEILSLYLRVICLRQWIFGIDEATRYHFSKHARDLTIAESSILISMIPSPIRFWNALQKSDNDHGTAYNFRHGYEKILTLHRALARIGEDAALEYSPRLTEILAAAQHADPDNERERSFIVSTAEVMHQIPGLLSQLRSLPPRIPNTLVEELSPEELGTIYFFMNPALMDPKAVAAKCMGADQDQILRLAAEHRIVQLAREKEISISTYNYQLFLEQGYRMQIENSAEFLRKRHFFEEIAAHLTREEIPFLLVKGMELALRYYPDPGLRPFSDIDLIVSREYFSKAARILDSHGFAWRTGNKSCDERSLDLLSRLEDGLHFKNTAHPLEIDVHPMPTERFKKFFERSERLELSTNTALAVLGWEDELQYLLFHGRKHHWYKLIWISDIYQVLQSLTQEQISELHNRSVREGWEPTFLNGIGLTQLFYQFDLEPSLARRAITFNAKTALISTSFIKRHIFARENSWKRAAENLRRQLKYEGTVSAKALFLAQRFLIPTKLDVSLVSLPRGVFFLYFIIRPIRIAARFARSPFSYPPRQNI